MALDLDLEQDQDLDLDFEATLDLIEAVKDQKKAQKILLLQKRVIRNKWKNIVQEMRKEGGKLKRLYFKKLWRISTMVTYGYLARSGMCIKFSNLSNNSIGLSSMYFNSS